MRCVYEMSGPRCNIEMAISPNDSSQPFHLSMPSDFNAAEIMDVAMLEVKYIHRDESFPSVLREQDVVSGIDIAEFHQADGFWRLLNERYNLKISYFSDEIIRHEIITAALRDELFQNIEAEKVKSQIYNLFRDAADIGLGLVFIVD